MNFAANMKTSSVRFCYVAISNRIEAEFPPKNKTFIKKGRTKNAIFIN